jgi:hypothetical protein
MQRNYAINDDVRHRQQGSQGRTLVGERSVYAIIPFYLPIDADGRPRYRIRSKTEKVERGADLPRRLIYLESKSVTLGRSKQ